ncbi:LAMI_0H14180g1_1 [Lachancea mirantina]|uniref:tRNA ligase n=1 Tax=Lachancea mirantina TaxID=1230905 RepID=A0A1G4KI00_9SACH|nr:LAMI_0H14180g1_1 [Lachancea mirantina]
MADSRQKSVKQLVTELEAASQLQRRGKAYSFRCDIFEHSGQLISWKFNEWDYGKNNITLPTNARGLFISDDPEDPTIVARGYDKFFNVDEVNATKWEELERNTKGPYEVTVKENGCIIFISGLADGTLVVCSKHSTGPREDSDRNHALAGKTFLEAQLKALDIDPRALAQKLYQSSLTAVAEYCDDSFEEHILEYTKSDAGLYLHGLNYNQPTFATLPTIEVRKFADEFGFKKIEYLVKPDIFSLRKFLESCSETGSYQGQEIEGFVIRSKILNGEAFFFKFKFEEPYLMYRQWREVTKEYILSKSRVFRFRKHKFITNKYLDFVIPILDSSPDIRENYLKDIGIISMRKQFLDSYGLSGLEILNHEKVRELEMRNAVDYDKVDKNTKFIIIPIATIGCGKTTTALTLKNLYPETWQHVQNDDITGRDKSMLMKKSLELLAQDGVKCVIIDRNNHQYRERKQLFEWFTELKEDYLPYDCNVKIIGVSFLSYEDVEDTTSITIKRVMARGDNHQSIKAISDGQKKVLGIMNGFLQRYQPLRADASPDCSFDFVLQLSVKEENSSLLNAKRILTALHKEYAVLVPKLPSDSEINSAFEQSLHYRPTITKIVKGQDKKEFKHKPIYFSAEVSDVDGFIKNLSQLVESSSNGVDTTVFEKVIEEGRCQKSLHITLGHVISGRKGTKKQKDLWCEYNKRYSGYLLKSNSTVSKSLIKTSDFVNFKLDKLIWDDKIMAALVLLDDECVFDEKTQTPVPHLSCANEYSHITVALLQPGVKPFYSNALCQAVTREHGNVAGNHPDGTTSVIFKDAPTLNARVCINI